MGFDIYFNLWSIVQEKGVYIAKVGLPKIILSSIAPHYTRRGGTLGSFNS
jgi:hypothetical protein